MNILIFKIYFEFWVLWFMFVVGKRLAYWILLFIHTEMIQCLEHDYIIWSMWNWSKWSKMNNINSKCLKLKICSENWHRMLRCWVISPENLISNVIFNNKSRILKSLKIYKSRCKLFLDLKTSFADCKSTYKYNWDYKPHMIYWKLFDLKILLIFIATTLHIYEICMRYEKNSEI